MKVFATSGSALLVALLLAGCQTGDQGSGVRQGATVTRFHLGADIARGEIAVEPADPGQGEGLEYAHQAAAVERELARLGWRVMSGNTETEQVALVRVREGSRESMGSGSTVSFGVGGGGGSYGGGGIAGGVGATVPVGGGPSEILVTELAVRIQRRSDATIAWEGRAQLEARADALLASRPAAIDRLAEALFRDFPGVSGQTVQVR